VIRQIASRLSLPVPHATSHLDLQDQPADGRAAMIDCGDVDLPALRPGQFSAQTGRASFEAVEFAIAHTLDGHFDAIVTAPIQKEAWHAADVGFLGHTELLAQRTGAVEHCMMLSGESCSTVLATIHLPLRDAIQTLSTPAIGQAIRLGGLALEKRLQRAPRITVLGLNPHAGENGLLSHGEEERLIVPAIEQVRQWSRREQRDWELVGPVPPDTAFTPAMRSRTDVHICMYHDQGLIPLKALSFDNAVNVTLGLPIVRTSPDHGTAMDLAWQGRANPDSMRAAIAMAIDLAD
jgi:4-hydroxythreonine-4-phosphate dehydrogenase